MKRRWGRVRKVPEGSQEGGELEEGERRGKRRGKGEEEEEEEGEEGEGAGGGRGRGKRKLDYLFQTCGCMKFYYSLLSPVPLPPCRDSIIAPSRVVRIKRITSNDVNFILGWPVT